jgi:hypothetical protein
MNLPFTVEQFFTIFSQYNHAVWPAQLVLIAMALAAIVLVIWPRARSGITVSAILFVLWAWLGVAYHLVFFSRINRLAFAFAAVSVLGSFVFLAWGVVRRRVRFEGCPRWQAWSGGFLFLYALLIYPALSWAGGHPYFSSPTFGVPCPTTIFTFGVLAFATPPLPRVLLAVPLLWSVIGGQAALRLGVPQDFGLWVAGVFGVVLMFGSRRRIRPGLR